MCNVQWTDLSKKDLGILICIVNSSRDLKLFISVATFPHSFERPRDGSSILSNSVHRIL